MYNSGNLLSALSLVLVLAACSDSGNGNRSTTPEPTPAPPLLSITTPNADRCEILDSNNCLFPWPSNQFTVSDDSVPPAAG